VPLSAPRVEGYTVYYYGFLKAGGQFVSDAIGEARYIPKNPKDSYGFAVEKAKSDCLVRCCKILPLFRECWDKEYSDYWKSTYAHEVHVAGENPDRQWRKKGEYARNFNTKPGKEHEGEFRKPPRVEDENAAHIESLRRERLQKAARAYVLRNDSPKKGLDPVIQPDEFVGMEPGDVSMFDDARED
jgi:Mitochondrial genome maintenance MGM101